VGRHMDHRPSQALPCAALTCDGFVPTSREPLTSSLLPDACLLIEMIPTAYSFRAAPSAKFNFPGRAGSSIVSGKSKPGQKLPFGMRGQSWAMFLVTQSRAKRRRLGRK
jgi:hypothetical protein